MSGKEFLGNMTENEQADCVQSRQAGFVQGCLKTNPDRNSRTAGDAVRLYYLYRDFGVQETGKSVNFAALQKVYKIIERKIGKRLAFLPERCYNIQA